MNKRIITLIIALLSMSTGTALMAQVTSPYAVYKKGVLTFYYDTSWSTRDGKIYELKTSNNFPGWHNVYGDSITKVVFQPSFHAYINEHHRRQRNDVRTSGHCQQ